MTAYDFWLEPDSDTTDDWIDERARDIGREIGYRALADIILSARFVYRHKAGKALRYWTRVYVLDRLYRMAERELERLGPDEYVGDNS